MKPSQQVILPILIMMFATGGPAVADEIDPFAELRDAAEKQAAPKPFETTGGFKVAPGTGFDPEVVPPREWKERGLAIIEQPVGFNRHFIHPFRIWRVDGGHFGAFDGGEWGGALFFAAEGATRWTRIINTHIQDLERFEGDTLLATGGLAHTSLSGGEAFLVTRSPAGEWLTRKIFRSDVGIPRIAGITATDMAVTAESKKLIVLRLENPLGRGPLFGIDATGAVHCIGEPAGNKPDGKTPPSANGKPED